jgi:ABC-type branched-subunit amino acid transport system substrate-binding protein
MVGATIAAVLLLASCGTRGDPRAAERVDAGPTPTATESSSTEADATVFGTLPSPCGPTPAGMTLTASDQGVTPESITVATIADPGGPVPGLNQGIFDSMDAFAEWCNAQGGINGRELVVKKLDAGVLQYRERVLEACEFAFALVGGGGALDELGAQEAVDCGLVDVPGFTVSALKSDSDRMVQPAPNPSGEYNVGAARWMAEEDPDAIEKAASLYTKVETTEIQEARHREAYEQVGFDFVYEAAANLNEVNWAPLIVAMRGSEVEYVTLTSSFEEGVNLQKAMVEQGFEPTFFDLEANYYNPKYPAAAGKAADGTLVRLTAVPFEEADENPAMSQYLEALAATNGDDVVPELLGVQSWSAGLLFATAVKALGADVTRDALLAELESIHEWDGGGLHGPNDPGNNRASGCFVVMEVVDGGFERRYPEEGLDCDQGNLVELEGDYGEGAKEAE